MTEQEILKFCREAATACREAARDSRGKGDDETAEIYIGQALAYASVAKQISGRRDEDAPLRSREG